MSVTTPTPPPPIATGRDTLIAERDALLAELREIDTDLGADRRYHPGGIEYSKFEYDTWRRSAKHARTKKLNRYTEIKGLLRRMEPEIDPRAAVLASIDSRLETVVDLLQRILEAQFEPEATP